MKRPIKDIMEDDAYTCRYDQTLGEVVQLFNELGTSGLTVVDEERHVVGFISDGDIMKAVSEQKTRSIFSGYSSMLLYDNESFEDKARALRDRNVMELATTKVLCATPDQYIGTVADVLAKKRFKKVPVVDESGVLVGVVRRATITKYIFHVLFDDEPGFDA
ncbi:CBS domain-containing protein [Arabiibacter massiliensis]|uniref:CBS domain-containing protein n=1 Tax=Arabiibacter massiliensis TaxID=1870985 RepID=UPI0009B9E541|nr:CBS domain-containing protein [Arabiibacter massiliensis]